jgi:hypothetical protein
MNAACERECAARVEGAAYAIMSRDLANGIRALEKLGARILLIDITGNGGGSEWVGAAARVVSPLNLLSERRGFVRGEHWASNWESMAKDLRLSEGHASGPEGEQLERWAQQLDRAKAQAQTPCSSEAFWSGQRPTCEWLGDGFYATGVLGEADATALRGKPWASFIFSPTKYDFEMAVWHGPILVLIDGNTGSAAEEFAAVLQDNKAAVVIGSPSAGAGCGHTNGGTPTTLTHSGGILELPDCAGFVRTDRMRSGASIRMYSSGSGRRTVCVGRAYVLLKRSRAVSLRQSVCVSVSTVIDVASLLSPVK